MEKQIRKILSSLLVASTVLCGTEVVKANTKNAAIGKKQTYIVKTESDEILENLDKTFDSVETVSTLSKDIMKEEKFITLKLTSEEAEKMEKKGVVSVVEPDVMVKGSAQGYARKITKMIKFRKSGENMEWNLQSEEQIPRGKYVIIVQRVRRLS